MHLEAQFANFGTTGVYTQNFGNSTDAGFTGAGYNFAPGGGTTAHAALWNGADYYTGWWTYMDAPDGNGGVNYYNGLVDITNSTTPTNTGGIYMYTINGGPGLLLGTRPSNTTAGGASDDTCNCDGDAGTASHGGDPDVQLGIALGLCLKNTNNTTIKSINIQFDWYQLSTAEDGGQDNLNFLDYLIKTSVPSLTATTYTNILKYRGPDISGAGNCCTSQLSGVAGTEFTHFNTCINLGTGIPKNSYIMFRWWDPNDPEDDPHFAIDNIQVTDYSDVACSVVLPIKLLYFTAEYNQSGQSVALNWSTASEVNNKEFIIEKTKDAQTWETVATVAGAGNSSQTLYYSADDASPYTGTSYYRIKQVDNDGNISYSDYQSVNINPSITGLVLAPNPSNDHTTISFISEVAGTTILNIYDWTGKLVETKNIDNSNGIVSYTLNTSGYKNGIYFVTINNTMQVYSAKLVVNHN